MMTQHSAGGIVQGGDRRGLGVVYAVSGDMICHPGETILKAVANWDIDVMSPWRRILPKTIFSGFRGEASSRLYVTSERIVLVRDVDEWRELAGELTPLGLPNAAAKERYLKALKRAGIRQFCQIEPQALVVVAAKKYTKHGSMIDLKLIGDDHRQYAVMIWKTDGRDDETLDLIESRFRH